MGFLNKCAVNITGDKRLGYENLKDLGLNVPPDDLISSDDVKMFMLSNRGKVNEGSMWLAPDIKEGTGEFEGWIYCGNNVELFLALATVRDDTDKNQWFIYDNEKDEPIWFLCNEDNLEDEMFYDMMFLDCRKATNEEIIKYFNVKVI